MHGKKANRLKIRIIEDGETKINLTLPLFIISALLFFIPSHYLNKWTEEDVDVKKMYKDLKKHGKGTKINVNEGDDLVNIEFK